MTDPNTHKPYCYPDQTPEKDDCLPMSENRIEPTTPADGSQTAVSPTGAALLPPKAVPYAVALLGVLGGIAALPTMGISLLPVAVTQGALVATLILGPLLGVASPGLRKK